MSAQTSVAPYQQGGYPPGYEGPYDGGYDGADPGQQRGGVRRWLPWLIAALVALAAIIVAVILLTSGNGGGTFVPAGLVGETQAQAVAQIKAAGLVPQVVQQTSSTVQKGRVIGTDPADGHSIGKGGTVTVKVSAGIATATLPSVTGEQYSAALAQLKNAGFTNVQEQIDSQSTMPANEVDKMTPAANAKYAPDQQIILYVSAGGSKVPNVSSGNETYLEAEAILKADGFVVDAEPVAATSPVQPGVVYNQNPPANSVKPAGSTILIFFEPLTSTPSASPTPTPSAPTASPTPTATATATPSPAPTGTGTPTATSPGFGQNPPSINP